MTLAATLSGFVDNFLVTEALEHGALAVARTPCAIRSLLEDAMHSQGEAAEGRILLAQGLDDAMFTLDPSLIGDGDGGVGALCG